MAIISRRTKRKGTVYDVYFRDLSRKEKSKTFYRLKDAQTFEADLISKKVRDEFPDWFPKKSRLTFSQLAEKWLKLHSRIHKAPLSVKRDEGIIFNHLVPVFGSHDIKRITTDHIQTYMVTRVESTSPKTGRKVTGTTVNREFEILRKMFNDAIKWKLMKSNPCHGVTRFREERSKFDYLTEDEIPLFLEQSGEIDRPLFAMAIYTGMRLGELLNLTWSNVDLKQNSIAVKIGNEQSQTTKSRKPRWIPISSALRPYLLSIKRNDAELVFPSKLGAGNRRQDVRKAFKATLRRAGVKRHIRFHDTRHTFASHFVMRGGDLLSLMELLGHSSLQMVQRYSHLAPEHLRDAVERLNFSIAPKKKTR